MLFAHDRQGRTPHFAVPSKQFFLALFRPLASGGNCEAGPMSWFGSVLGEDGKPFKTRAGDTVRLEDFAG